MRLPKPFAVSTLSACAAVACGSTSPPAAPAARIFTGTVDGTDAQVAVVASARHLRVYFCGGPASYATMTHWFTLDLDPSGAAHAQADAAQTWSLDGQVGDTTATGAITIADGTRFTFATTRVSAGTIAGLYEGMAGCGKIGLIVTLPSAQAAPSGQGACITADLLPSVEQVNPIRPLTRASDGTISVLVAGATDSVIVRAAAPPQD
jgi:hypothetical protein